MRGYYRCEYSYEVGELHSAVSFGGESWIGLLILQVKLLLIPFCSVASIKLPFQIMLVGSALRATTSQEIDTSNSDPQVRYTTVTRPQ